MKVIIHTTDAGGIVVTTPTPEFLETHTIEEVMAKDCPPHAIIIDSSELPQNEDEFFDAWELVNGIVKTNINKSKEITKNRLRLERAPLLQEQDVAFQRALETGVDTSAIVAEKQRLRDITKLADEVTTIQELKALTV